MGGRRRQPKRGTSKRGRRNVKELCVVEEILDKRMDAEGRIEHLVKWWGFSSEQNTWEPRDNLIEDCPAMVLQFDQEQGLISDNELIRVVAAAESENDLTKKVYSVERILQKKEKNGFVKYFVKWKGYATEFNSWECAHDIMEEQSKLVEEFEAQQRGGIQPTENYVVQDEQQPCCSKSVRPLISSTKGPGPEVAFVGDRRVEFISDVTLQEGVLYFMLKCAGIDEAQFVSYNQANILFPQLVLQFCEERAIIPCDDSGKAAEVAVNQEQVGMEKMNDATLQNPAVVRMGETVDINQNQFGI